MAFLRPGTLLWNAGLGSSEQQGIQATGQTQHRHILFMAETTTLCVCVYTREHVWSRGRGLGKRARLLEWRMWEAERRWEGELNQESREGKALHGCHLSLGMGWRWGPREIPNRYVLPLFFTPSDAWLRKGWNARAGW